MALLAAIAAVALGLRLWRLGDWSFWVDEVLTTERALERFGFGERSARLGPALLGSLSIPLLYWAFTRVVERSVSLVAVGLLAVNPWHLFWSQSSRGYAGLVLFYALGLVALFEGLETANRRKLALAPDCWPWPSWSVATCS